MTLAGKAIRSDRVSGGVNHESGCSAITNGGVPAKPATKHRASGAIRKVNRDSRIRDNRVSDWRTYVLAGGLARPGDWEPGAAGSRGQTVTKGAIVHAGGKVPDGEGAFYPATVLSAVTPAMRAFHEELFGPVAVLHKVASVDEAIELANDSPYGLGSAVFTRDEDEADYVANRLEVGMVGVNTTIKSAPDMPFGGVKNSGIGRELGRFGLDEFANKKLVRIA